MSWKAPVQVAERLQSYAAEDARATIEVWRRFEEMRQAERDERLALVVTFLAIVALAAAAALGLWRCS